MIPVLADIKRRFRIELSTILLLILFVFSGMNSLVAQNLQEDVYLGLGVAFAEETEVLGIQGNVAFAVRDDARVAADFTHFFWHDREFTAFGIDVPFREKNWEINFNGHYLIINSENAVIYGLIGLQYFKQESEIYASDLPAGITPADFPQFVSSDSGIGANVGGGLEFILNAFGIFIEPKYTLGGSEQFSITSGFRARF